MKTATLKSRTAFERVHELLELTTQPDKHFANTLKDIYWSEKHLGKALGKMQRSATTNKLRDAIGKHITQADSHAKRLEYIFSLLGKRPLAKRCLGMEALIREGELYIEETGYGSMTRDTAIVITMQKILHYEIAAYGGLMQLAHVIGREEAVAILEQTLEEKKETDHALTMISANNINWAAEQEEIYGYIDGEE